MINSYEDTLKSIFKNQYGQEQAKDAVYFTLKDGIVKRIIPSGITLNSSFLSKFFYLSRTPVENALFRLHSEGLIQANQQNGYITFTYGFDEARDSNEFMLYLYMSANLMARNNLDFYYQNVLEKELDKLDQITDLKEYLYEGSSFHMLIAESTGNQNLIQTLLNEINKSSLIPLNYEHDSHKAEQFIEEHKQQDRELLEVLLTGDMEDVIRKSKEHNEHIMQYVFKNLLTK